MVGIRSLESHCSPVRSTKHTTGAAQWGAQWWGDWSSPVGSLGWSSPVVAGRGAWAAVPVLRRLEQPSWEPRLQCFVAGLEAGLEQSSDEHGFVAGLEQTASGE